MTHNARFIAIAIVIVLGCVFVIVNYARLILCAWCRSPWAVYARPIGDLCRACAKTYDHEWRRRRTRAPLPWRLWRRAS